MSARLRGSKLDAWRRMPVVESAACVATKWVWRTWRERWLSRPWDPFRWRKQSNEPAMFLVRSPDAEGYLPVSRSQLPVTPFPYVLAHPDRAVELRAEISRGVPQWPEADRRREMA